MMAMNNTLVDYFTLSPIKIDEFANVKSIGCSLQALNAF